MPTLGGRVLLYTCCSYSRWSIFILLNEWINKLLINTFQIFEVRIDFEVSCRAVVHGDTRVGRLNAELNLSSNSHCPFEIIIVHVVFIVPRNTDWIHIVRGKVFSNSLPPTKLEIYVWLLVGFLLPEHNSFYICFTAKETENRATLGRFTVSKFHAYSAGGTVPILVWKLYPTCNSVAKNKNKEKKTETETLSIQVTYTKSYSLFVAKTVRTKAT